MAVTLPTPTPQDNDTLQAAIEKAAVLIDQKHDILAELQEMRVLAHLLVKAGVGSESQVAWVQETLPRKKRRNGDAEDEDGEDAELTEIEDAA